MLDFIIQPHSFVGIVNDTMSMEYKKKLITCHKRSRPAGLIGTFDLFDLQSLFVAMSSVHMRADHTAAALSPSAKGFFKMEPGSENLDYI